MNRYFYSDSISIFLDKDETAIVGELARSNPFALEQSQLAAWIEQIQILRVVLGPYRDYGTLFFEYSIPRLGRRIDVVVLIQSVVFTIEFKVGEAEFTSSGLDQVWDYALDLKNFHEPTHSCTVVPILVATGARLKPATISLVTGTDGVLAPIRCNKTNLGSAIASVLQTATQAPIEPKEWQEGRYCPTPTIIEAAMALWGGHSVEEISNRGAVNLSQTSDAISQIIANAKLQKKKLICFVTGVPGAGKTLVGLDIATTHVDKASALHSVYLSGNGPLVAILREALARDKIKREKDQHRKISKKVALSEVSAFIQNVHHFRDDCLVHPSRAPVEHVAIFDEAQRAWNVEQTSKFMRQKKGMADFHQSEPEFLISCLDRHPDWAVIVCLVGGGQEINTGEGGISEWVRAINNRFPQWAVHLSPHLTDSEYAADEALTTLKLQSSVTYQEELHLATSMRSFRAENVSLLVKHLLDLRMDDARQVFEDVNDRYPIVITRDLHRAKAWLRENARGSERYGIVASSQAMRLKPHAIDVRVKTDPVHWFLDDKHDIRSSFYCEDVATEFDVQGLELDWTCVTWDADFRYTSAGWEHWSFRGDKWQQIRNQERQKYLKNAYRVLLTRARQGMVIAVPYGDANDATRREEYYLPIFELLKSLGLKCLD
jgi:DUF2075 family protein